MTWIDFVGYLAALTVLMTFCMDTIVPLRGLAIASNVLFIVYGIAGQLYPVLLLHALLLPSTSPKLCGCKCEGSTPGAKAWGEGAAASNSRNWSSVRLKPVITVCREKRHAR